MSERQDCVYIMTNIYNTVLYTGVTNDLQRRILEHKSGKGSRFTKKYNITKLVYFETGDDINTAIAREKQTKRAQEKRRFNCLKALTLNGKTSFKNCLAARVIARERSLRPRQSPHRYEIASLTLAMTVDCYTQNGED